ncbi:hypothetical protein [Methanoculleus chikugoensis]|uniref:hypothetical protein n=1 Tax=Methanoculleus chikugoensis TaxID=118126 RepID=UPI0006CFA02F|nr:hypothetical protein [Methanoculleus chikugoensis]
MIGDNVYVITREAPVWIRDEIALPEVRTDGGEAIMPDVYRPGTPLQNYVFYTASAFSVKNDGGALPTRDVPPRLRHHPLCVAEEPLHRYRYVGGPRAPARAPQRCPPTPAAERRRSSTGSRSMTGRSTTRPWAGFPDTS